MPLYPARALERAMKIKEVITRAMSGQINWMQAAEIIGISDRSMRRWRKRLEYRRLRGLVGSANAASESRSESTMADVEKVLRLYREKYFDLNVKHFVEKLHSEEQISLSYTWVKTALQNAGLVKRYTKRGPAPEETSTASADGDDAARGWEPSSMDSGIGSISGPDRDFR